MRNPNRIDAFMAEVGKVWKENFPDWRFGQFLVNFLGWYGSDPWFMEEDKFIEELHKFVKSLHAPNK